MLMVYGLALCVVLCLWQTQCNPSDQTLVTLPQCLVRTNQTANVHSCDMDMLMSEGEKRVWNKNKNKGIKREKEKGFHLIITI